MPYAVRAAWPHAFFTIHSLRPIALGCGVLVNEIVEAIQAQTQALAAERLIPRPV